MNRRDAVLRHRAGYVAALDGAFQAPDDRETLLFAAASPTEARGIGVTAKAARLKDGPVQLALAVDGHTLSLGEPGATARRELEVMVVSLRDGGEVLEGDSVKLAVNAAEDGERLLRDGITATRSLTHPRMRASCGWWCGRWARVRWGPQPSRSASRNKHWRPSAKSPYRRVRRVRSKMMRGEMFL